MRMIAADRTRSDSGIKIPCSVLTTLIPCPSIICPRAARGSKVIPMSLSIRLSGYMEIGLHIAGPASGPHRVQLINGVALREVYVPPFAKCGEGWGTRRVVVGRV